ncbi:class I SAM-dependent methyltransferase [Paracoccus tegillarcae]|uniref:SAM-dependent methyltransferase n=1 Tax=Paracoccus tegillarcae TaxID=1529068 RepID=A0A2K9EHM5_9RHOB|nr:class I SAM-dependent methyltransferase [Paracoccus tegillarcae]AUH33839.1 SAM-dependent methyltransferase [Paracoccus tegillarcae]
MNNPDNGWEASARGWIADMGEHGDFSRLHVLDDPMMARIRGRGFQNALDIGCGEGRFCRMLAAEDIKVTGIEPTKELRQTAEARDPAGLYLDASAEALPFDADSFDLAVAYLTLIDIDGIDAATTEIARVLRPGGTLLVANLNSFNTAGGWRRREDGSKYFALDNYLDERAEWVSWGEIHIRNWHRPFGRYMELLLNAGLRLTHFEEPAPTGGDPDKVERCKRVPFFHLMEWQKP